MYLFCTIFQPVQRLCRYQLLLREIDRAISDTIENSKSLKLALDIMHSVVNNINTEKQRQDVALMTTRFIERLEGDWVGYLVPSDSIRQIS